MNEAVAKKHSNMMLKFFEKGTLRRTRLSAAYTVCVLRRDKA
jgi:hypothetical protein